MCDGNEYKPTFNKDLFEALETLRKAAWDSFYRRQSYEWKWCVAIWTPLLAFIGIALKESHVWIPWHWMVPMAILLLVLHIVWQVNLKNSNDNDNNKMYEFENNMREVVGLEVWKKSKGGKFLERLKNAFKKPKDLLVIKGWSHWIYIIISAGLILTACYVNSYQRSVFLLSDSIISETKSMKLEGKKRDEYLNKILIDHFKERKIEGKSKI